MPIAGLLLSAKLAEVLDVRAGESVRVEVQEGQRPQVDILVAGTIADYAGLGAYMEIGAAAHWTRSAVSSRGTMQ